MLQKGMNLGSNAIKELEYLTLKNKYIEGIT